MTDVKIRHGLLICPSCGDDYLHHDRIVSHTREEDETAVVQVVYVPESEDKQLQIPENPSSRRSGVVISGFCENCRKRWDLTLAQHKGQTEIEMQAV